MARTKSLTPTQRIKALEKANEELRARNVALTERLKTGNALARGWRTAAIVFCVALATAVLIVGNLLFWAGDTLVNNQKYTETVTPLLQDTAIQSAVASYTTTKLFENVDVDQVVQEALPPRAEFLAAPLAAQVQNGTQQALQKAVASERFQRFWAQANSKAQERLITSLKNSKGDGVLNLQDVYDRLGQNLADTKLSFLAGKQLPSNVGSIVVIEATWVPTARPVFNNIGWIKPFSLALVTLFSAGAIWLSRNRRKMVIILGSFFSAGMVISLISLRVATHGVVNHVTPAYRTAAEHAAEIVTRPLILQTRTVLVVSVVIALAAWLTGPYRSAAAFRSRISLLLSGSMHQALFKRETAFTRWIAAYKRQLQWSSVAGVAVIMLFVRLSPRLVLLYALLAVLLVLAVELLAAPGKSAHRTK